MDRNVFKRKGVLFCLFLTATLSFSEISHSDTNAIGYLDKARRAMLKANLKEAELAFHRAIFKDKKLLEAHLGLIDLYIARRNLVKASEQISKAKGYFPDSADVWVREGYVLNQLSESEAALAAYKKAESYAGEDVELLKQVSGYYAHSGHSQLEALINKRMKKIELSQTNGGKE